MCRQPSNVQNAKIMSHDLLINEHGLREGFPQPKQHKRMIALWFHVEYKNLKCSKGLPKNRARH